MNVLNSLLAFVLLYKYAAVALVVYLAAVIVPLPANAMLLAVGAFSSQGYFNFWIAFVVAVTANTGGDLTDYFITRIFGERVVHFLRLQKFKFYEQLKEEFRTDAAITVFTTRFASSLSPIASFLAGLVGVPLRIFFINDLLGNVIEPGAALAIGYVAGDYWNDFSGIIELFAAIVAVSVIIFILYRIHRRMRRRYDD